MEQIVRNARFSLRNGRSEFTVQLRPEHLGLLRMRLVLEENLGVRVEATVQNESTRQIIESNLPELRDSLSDLGVRVERFDVSVGQEFSESLGRQGQPGDREETPSTPSSVTQDVEAQSEILSDRPVRPRSLGYNTVEFVA